MLNLSIETKHFSVFYDESDGNIMEQIVTLIDDTYDRTVKQFELKADSSRHKFMLCPNRASFKQLTANRMMNTKTGWWGTKITKTERYAFFHPMSLMTGLLMICSPW